MDVLFLDFETYYDDQYSLTKMTTAEYIKDERFKVIGASYAHGEGPTRWADPMQLFALISETDWANTKLVAHNTTFDGAILSFVYGVQPAMLGDTLSMARYVFDMSRYNLASVAKLLGLPDKGNALVDTKGKTELTKEEYDALVDYAIRDTEICQAAYYKMLPSLPKNEHALIDITLRMYTNPRLKCLSPKLREYEERLRGELANKQDDVLGKLREVLGDTPLTEDAQVFTSNKKFESLLIDLGVDIPKKLKRATPHQAARSMARRDKMLEQVGINTAKIEWYTTDISTISDALAAREASGKNMSTKKVAAAREQLERRHGQIADLKRANESLEADIKNALIVKKGQLLEVPALAKNDQGLLDLLEHDDDLVVDVVDARIGSMSTINMTRAVKLANVADAMDGYLPVPLAYCAAGTNRWGGREYNMQNLPARGRDKTLRESLVAPEGYKIIAADLAQIEPRVLAWLAGEEALLESFRSGRDFYTALHGKIFGSDYDTMYAGYKNDEYEWVYARNVAKAVGLGLGFGQGHKNFVNFAKVAAKVTLSEEESKDIVNAYRDGVPGISQFWQTCNDLLPAMSTNAALNVVRNKCLFRRGFIYLPSGRMLRYDNLRSEEIAELDENGDVSGKRRAWVYGPHGVVRFIYGSKVVENLVQALARDIVADMAIQVDGLLDRTSGESIVMLVHDEIVAVVQEGRVDYLSEEIKRIMHTTPSYTPGLPVACSLHVANNYAEAK
jgi:DNA polymerase I-like protein with 3'-5' exonuclease and polymerase domains